jgi:hypothetical protein
MWQQPNYSQGLKRNAPNAKVLRSLFFQVGTYADQMRRPLNSGGIDLRTIAQLETATQGGTNFTRSAVAQVANDIIRPNAQHEGVAAIDHGWAEQRASFMIEFSQPLPGGLEVRKVITGYTNYLGISTSGAIDPQLILYINSVMTLRTKMTHTPTGNVLTLIPSTSETLLTGHFSNGGVTPNELSLRPMDIYTQLTSQADVMSFAGEGPVYDSRSTFASGPILSDRGHSFNASYVSKMLTAAQQGFALQNDGIADLTAVYREASGIMGERAICADNLLEQLVATDGLWNKGAISWQRLMGLFPDIDNKTTVVFAGGAHAKQTAMPHVRGQTEYWHGSNAETVLATQIGQTIPGLMMENMLGNISLMITNDTIGTIPTVTITREPLSLTENVDLVFYVNRFKQFVLTELVPGITYNNNACVTVHITADVYNETSISISFNHGPFIDYVSPTFCDNRFSALVTYSPQVLDGIKRDFSNIISTIGTGSQTPSAPSHHFSAPPVNSGSFSTAFMPSLAATPVPTSPIITAGSERWK